MKKDRMIRNVSILFHLVYLLMGLWGFYLNPSFLVDTSFVVSLIYGSLLIVTTVHVTVTTLKYAKKRNAKNKEEMLRTSFGSEDPHQQVERQAYQSSSRFWTLNGLLTFGLSSLLVVYSFLQGVVLILADILSQGGSVNLQAYFKIGETLKTLSVIIVILFILLFLGMLASFIIALVLKSKVQALLPQKGPLEAQTPINEEIPMDDASTPFKAFETPETEKIVEPVEEVTPEEPSESKEKIRPEQIKPPKEVTPPTPEYLEEIEPILIQVKAKQMLLDLPNPPSFTPLPGLPNVAWVNGEALVIYFDYTSKQKSILEECVKNNPKTFLFSDIDRLVLEGPEGAELAAFYYRENSELQKLVFPKACYEVLKGLVPEKPVVQKLPNEQTKQVPPPMIKPNPSDPNDPNIRLAKLERLYEKKLISTEEYEKKKKEIRETR